MCFQRNFCSINWRETNGRNAALMLATVGSMNVAMPSNSCQSPARVIRTGVFWLNASRIVLLLPSVSLA